MPLLELDPRLALLPAVDLAALLVAVSEAQKDTSAPSVTKGVVVIAGKQYRWNFSNQDDGEKVSESTSTLVVKIAPNDSMSSIPSYDTQLVP